MRAPDRAPDPRTAPQVRRAAHDPETDRPARIAGLVAVLAAIAALPASELLPAGPAAIAVLLTLAAAWLSGRGAAVARNPALRGLFALAAVSAVLGLTVVSPGPALLLPEAGEMPSGTVAAAAAGALAAVVLEFAARRGLLSAMLLCLAVFGLCAALATDNRQLVPSVVAGWPALMVAVSRAGAVPGGRRRAARMHRLPGPGGVRAALRWDLLPALLTIALACGVLVLLRLGGGWSGITESEVGRGGGGTGSGATGRAVGQYVGTSMDLRARGDLSTDPVLRVPAGSPALWRGGWLDRYDGRRWTAGPVPARERLAVQRDEEDGSTFVAKPGPGALREPVRGVHEATVTPLEPWAVVAVAPGPVRRVTSAAFDDGGELSPGPGERLYLVDDRPVQPYKVRAIAQLSAGDAPGGVAAGADPDDPVDDRWTELPDSVPSRVLELGRQLAAGSTDRRAAVLAVEDEIRARVRYTLDSAQPRRGQDAVDDVLFTSREGFCEQFASAEVVLLRAAGIPARMATGFAGGERQGEARLLRQADGHAWVEVWFPGAGWVVSDPTAGATRATTWWESAVSTAREQLARLPLLVIGAVLLGILLLAALGVLALGTARRRSALSAEQDEEAGPRLPPELGAAFDRFEAALEETGRGRPPTESVAALARRLRAGPGADDAETAQALDVVQRALYAARLPGPAECLTAAGALDAAAERIVLTAREVASY